MILKNYHDNLLPHLSWYRIYHFLCFIINTEPRDHRCGRDTCPMDHRGEAGGLLLGSRIIPSEGQGEKMSNFV